MAYGDTISRKEAIAAIDEQIAQCNKALKSFVLSMKDEYAAKVEKASLTAFRERLEYLPPAQPDKDKVSYLLYHIYSIQSPHLDMTGVIAKKHYCEELWKELFGKESELPGWMS